MLTRDRIALLIVVVQKRFTDTADKMLMQRKTAGRRMTAQVRLFCFLVALAPAIAYSQVAQQSLLSGIEATVFSDGVDFQLFFAGSPPPVESFALRAPDQLVVDLYATSSLPLTADIARASHSAQARGVSSIEVISGGERSRLIVTLSQQMNHQITVANDSVLITLKTGASFDAAAQQPRENNLIESIEFERGASGEALIVITLAEDIAALGASTTINRLGSAGDIVLGISGVVVPEEWQRRFDASSFGTVVTGFDSSATPEGLNLRIRATGDSEFLAYQSGARYVVSVSAREPETTRQNQSQELSQYTEKVTGLSFQSVPVRRALFQLANFYGFNLIASDAIDGEITIDIEDVPWDQALALVLRMKRLSGRLEGNVLYVAPTQELAEQDLLDVQAAEQAEALAPLFTEYLQINYANARDIMQLLVGVGAESGRVAVPTQGGVAPRINQGLLSPRGSASVDTRTNIVIVRDTDEKLDEVRQMLATLDIAVRQVLIEARIVNVETSFGRELGIRWGLGGHLGNARVGGSQETTTDLLAADYAASDARAQAAIAGEAARLDALQSDTDPELIPAIAALARASVPIPRSVVSFPQALNVDFGVALPGASSFAIGYARNSELIELELSALESSGNGEVIARPKVTTQDKMSALIQSGVRIPYQSQAGGTAGGSTTEFEEAVLSLEVTPQITPDGRINMQLDIRQDSVASGTGAIPAINTNQVTTRALVNDGQTIVLGGVFREETATSESKTPVLGDIPYLGRLFKRTEHSSRRTELLIFITPRILEEEFD
jgi:type IV pilus assembly protein PilQ